MSRIFARGLYARVNLGGGKFGSVRVEIRRGSPVPVPNATSYNLRFMGKSVRKLVPLGKDLNQAFVVWQNHTSDLERIRVGKLPIHRDEPTASEKAAHRPTIAEVVETFIRENLDARAKGKLARQTVVGYNNAAIGFRDQVNVTYMDEITREVLLSHETWLYEHLKRRSYGERQATVDLRFRILKMLLSRNGIKMTKDRAGRQDDEGLLRYEEAPKKPKRATPDKYSDEEINKMLGAASLDEIDLIQFFLRLGVRSGEAKHATWSDIEATREDGKIVHQFRVQAKPEYHWKPKDKDGRVVPMEEKLYARLMARRERQTPRSELIFPNSLGCPDWHLLAKLKKVSKRAGLTSRSYLHKLRHTYATLMMVGSSDPRTVMELLGHADLRTTLVYLAPDLSKARRGMPRAFGGIGEGRLFDDSHEVRGSAVLASDSGPGRPPKILENTAPQSSTRVVKLHGSFEIPRKCLEGVGMDIPKNT